MSIALKCKISLSKKLRALLAAEGSSATLFIKDLKDGVGSGSLVISANGVSEKAASDIGETSIMLTVMGVEDSLPVDDGVLNIFSSGNNKLNSMINRSGKPERQDRQDRQERQERQDRQDIQEPTTLESNLAATRVPENSREMREAYRGKVDGPEMPLYKNERFQQFITDINALSEAIHIAKQRKSEITIDQINRAQNIRQRGLLEEAYERSRSIGVPAWIVNDKCASINLDDLNISLNLNNPYNLSNISAERLENSRSLKMAIKNGYVKFVSPDEANRIYEEQMAQEENIASAASPIVDSSVVRRAINRAENYLDEPDISLDDIADEEVTADSLSQPTEQERLISLTGVGRSMPEEQSVTTRRSFGNKPNQTQQVQRPANKPVPLRRGWEE